MPIALDPLKREPILLSRSTQSVACSKQFSTNTSTGNSKQCYMHFFTHHDTQTSALHPIQQVLTRLQLMLYYSRGEQQCDRTSQVSWMLAEPLDFVDCLAYIIKSLHPECCMFKTNFQQILPCVAATNAYMHFSTHHDTQTSALMATEFPIYNIYQFV